MKDENFRVLVLVVVAFLVVSLIINAFLASDLHAFSSPPVRMNGYLTGKGDPMPGYYFAPARSGTTPDPGNWQRK